MILLTFSSFSSLKASIILCPIPKSKAPIPRIPVAAKARFIALALNFAIATIAFCAFANIRTLCAFTSVKNAVPFDSIPFCFALLVRSAPSIIFK